MAKKVLFLTTDLPYPANSGGLHKSKKLIEYLSEEHELDLVCFLKSEKEEDIQKAKDALNINKLQVFKSNITRSLKTLFMSYINSDSLNIYRNFNEETKQWIDDHFNDYDIILIDHYEMFQYVELHAKKKQNIIFHEHNAEFILWERAAQFQGNHAKKIVLQKEAKRVKKAELRYCEKADYIWAAPNDIEKLVNEGADRSKFSPTFHLGNDTMLELPPLSCPENKNLLYIGTLSWEPNVDGLCWFLDEVWPILVSIEPDCVFNIIGKGADKRLVNRSKKLSNVHLLGFVDDLEDYYQNSQIYLVPLRFGSGIKVKVLDGMYRGIPCVTTDIGAEGLALDSNEIAIANTAEEYAKSVLNLLNDAEQWNKLSLNARNRASKDYTWETIMSKHMDEMREILNEQHDS